jgi:DNA-binding LacI/PurR family transcriptional regulator
MARGLVNNKTYLFGVNIPYLDLSFTNTIITGMEQKCIDLQYELLLTSMGVSDISFSDYDIGTLKHSLERLIFRHVDGIACFPAGGALEYYENVLEQGIPLIQLLRPIPDLPCPSITVDNERGMYLAAKHLLDHGRRRIGFINYHDPRFTEIRDRFRGFIRAHEEGGFSLDQDRYVVSCTLDFQGGYEAAKTLITRNPGLDAIVAATDYAAVGAVRACLDQGKKIPEEISIIGYDDMDFAELQGYKTLSTVRQPKRQIGVLAAELLYRLIQGETVTSVILEPELILRESS